jgi:hypothetical protein
MKILGLVFLAVLCGCASLRTKAGHDAAFDALLVSVSSEDANLSEILNTLGSPEKEPAAKVAAARENLAPEMKRADEIIQKADAALARTDLPREHAKVWISFPRIGMIEEGSADADAREIAEAQTKILACQFSLLNLKVAAHPDAKSEEDSAKFGKWLTEAKTELAGLRGAAAAAKPAP